MAKNSNGTDGGTNTPARSMSIDLDESQGRSAFAAWRMLFNLYGAQVEGWSPSDTGIAAKGFSVFADFDPEVIVKDIGSRTRRLGLLEGLPTLAGKPPAPYTSAEEITADTVQFYKGAVEEGSAKSPPYVKGAVANYKAANALSKKRGPKPKTIHLDRLDTLDESILSGMEKADIELLQAALERAANSKAPASPQVEAASA